MNDKLPRPTELAHRWVAAVVRAGETAVDATVGNGHDTVVLARLAGPAGRVIGFDVQAAAIEATRARLAGGGGLAEVCLFAESHAGLARRVPAGVAAVMFNLGYLPGGDHGVTTKPAETVAALDEALEVLRPGGIVTVVAYSGHPCGEAETAAVVAWAEHLDPRKWRMMVVRVHNTARPAPMLVAVWKNRTTGD